MIEMMKKGELDEKKIRKRLDGFLTKEMERKLFDLTWFGGGVIARYFSWLKSLFIYCID